MSNAAPGSFLINRHVATLALHEEIDGGALSIQGFSEESAQLVFTLCVSVGVAAQHFPRWAREFIE